MMFYGLTQLEDDYFGQFMNKFIALSPCVYYQNTQYYEYVERYEKMRELGINVISGPNWDSHAEVICDQMSEILCKYAKRKIDRNP